VESLPATSSDADVFRCPICGEEIREGVKKCRHCREWIERNCEICSVPLKGVFAARGLCAECAATRHTALAERPPVAVTGPRKSKATAIILAALLGGVGVHRFYLNRTGSGIFYLVFCWTLIPALLSFVEIFRLALMDESTFQRKYGG